MQGGGGSKGLGCGGRVEGAIVTVTMMVLEKKGRRWDNIENHIIFSFFFKIEVNWLKKRGQIKECMIYQLIRVWYIIKFVLN